MTKQCVYEISECEACWWHDSYADDLDFDVICMLKNDRRVFTRKQYNEIINSMNRGEEWRNLVVIPKWCPLDDWPPSNKIVSIMEEAICGQGEG